MKNFFANLWAELPKSVQSALVVAEGGAIGALSGVFTGVAPLCLSRACLKTYAVLALGGAVTAVRLWLRQSPNAAKFAFYNNSRPIDPGA
ncbi:MAG TPA: hypothetical protein VKY85_01290 [Candidatus Angelobacter sp.]|nr:hypothetical protein [Candidatus Angelobacter sp.]